MQLNKLLLLVLILCASSGIYCETVAQQPANFSDVDAGTATNPYQIATLANLRWLSENRFLWGCYTYDDPTPDPEFFIQTADIDATETINWNYGRGFAPIGCQYYIGSDGWVYCFQGNFNGQNFIISNLYIFSPPSPGNDPFYAPDYYQGIGMFGTTIRAVLQNIHLENATINGSTLNTGLLCGEAIQTSIINCFVSGNNNVTHIYHRQGGLIGFLDNSIVEYCGAVIYSDTWGYLVGMVGSPFSNTVSVVTNSYGRGSSQMAGVGLFRNVLEESEISKVYIASNGSELTDNRLAFSLENSLFNGY